MQIPRCCQICIEATEELTPLIFEVMLLYFKFESNACHFRPDCLEHMREWKKRGQM